VQTKPVKQEIRLGRYADGTIPTIIAHQPPEAAVSESKDRLRRLVERSADPVAMVDCEMRYLSVSRRWETDCGFGGGETLGRSHWELFPNLPEYWQQNARACLAGVLEYSEFVTGRSPVCEAGKMGIFAVEK
jgi:two-component system NtrC family sensor kinase